MYDHIIIVINFWLLPFHVLYKNGKTPIDLAETNEAVMIISDQSKLELLCISARAVRKFGIPYLGIVPKTLEKYISRH